MSLTGIISLAMLTSLSINLGSYIPLITIVSIIVCLPFSLSGNDLGQWDYFLPQDCLDPVANAMGMYQPVMP